MTTEMNNANNDDERDIFEELDLAYSQTPESKLAAYHQNQLMRRIAISINELCDAETAPFVARECQRHFWQGLNLQEPIYDPFFGPPKPDYSEDKIYWNCEPQHWPVDKPFEPRLPIVEMSGILSMFAFIEPDADNIVQRNLMMLKNLLRLHSTEMKFLTAAWCASRWNAQNELGALPTALRLCRFGFVKPEDVTHRRITLLSTLLDTPYESMQCMVGNVRSMVCLGFVKEDNWHGEAENVFDLLHLEANFQELLETPHQSLDELEYSILQLDCPTKYREFPPREVIVAEIMKSYHGELRTAYLASVHDERSDTVSLRALVNRITNLGFNDAQLSVLDDRIDYDGILMTAISTALKCRKRAFPMNQFEFLRELFRSARGLDTPQFHLAGSV